MYARGTNLLWSATEDGNYEIVKDDSPSTPINGTDTITFKAVSGIDKIQKIEDGIKGTKKMIKSKRGEDTDTVVATVTDATEKGYKYKYNIKFKPADCGQPITVDPEAQGGGSP